MRQYLKLLKKKISARSVLIAILLLATVLRFYNFPLRYGLGVETVRDAAIGIVGAGQLQAPLTGAFSSLGPFTFGPWYAYQMIISTLILRTPYAPWIYLTLISIVAVYVAYKIGELLLGKKFGLLLAFLFTISPAQIISATHLTSHNMTNIFAVLSFYIFLKILLKNVSYWWGFFLGLLIGIGMNLHFQMSGLLILPLIILFYKPKRYKYFLTSAAGVITAFIPLLFFELNNHWFDTRNIIYYLRFGKNAVYVPNSWTIYLRDFWPAFWADTFGIPVIFAVFLIVLFLATAFVAYRKKKLSILMIFLFIAFLSNFISLRYYWGPRFFGYLNFMRPFVFIFTAFTLYQISKIKYGIFVSCAIVLLIVGFSWQRNIETLQGDPFSISIYEQTAKIEKLYPNKTFTIYGCNRKISGGYVSLVYSFDFTLDKDKRLSSRGVPLGVSYQNCLDVNYKTVGDTTLVDLSGKSSVDLKKEGWGMESLETIYQSSANWWFKPTY